MNLFWALGTPIALGAPHATPPIVTEAAEQLCPTTEISQARTPDNTRRRRRSSAQRLQDHAVARWVTCAALNEVTEYRLWSVSDPSAADIITAAAHPPGSRARIEALERATDALPVAVAFLALEELSVLASLHTIEPHSRLAVAAGTIGGWGCPQARTWTQAPSGQETAWCTDGRDVETMAREGLARLVSLAQPSRDEQDWLHAATASRTEELWALLEQTIFPLTEPTPLPLLDAGVGSPLEPDLGWSIRVDQELVIWTPRPSFRFTRDGLEVTPASLRTRPPDEWSGTAVVYAAHSLSVGSIDQALREHRVGQPRLISRRGDVPIEVRLRWVSDERAQSATSTVVDLRETPSPDWNPPAAEGSSILLIVPAAFPLSALLETQEQIAQSHQGPISFVVSRDSSVAP